MDDPVNMACLALLNSPQAKNVKSLSLAFQNAQAYPVEQDANGITKETNIFLKRIQESNKLLGDATISWALEGTYRPMLSVLMDDNSSFFGISQSVAIIVYPKSQIAQIITNKAFLYVAIATYLVGAASVLNIISQVMERHILSSRPRHKR